MVTFVDLTAYFYLFIIFVDVIVVFSSKLLTFMVRLTFDSWILFLLRLNSCIKYLNYVVPHQRNIGRNINCQMQHFLSHSSLTNVA